MSAQSAENTPDFAFPEKVEKMASANLKSAIKHSDGEGIIKSLIQLGLAKSAINSDSLPSVISQIETVNLQQSNPATKALLNLLLAKIYIDQYESDRWTYDRRDASSTAGNDYRLWSGSQFKSKIIDLVNNALNQPGELRRIPIEEFKDVIQINDYARVYYPTLYDFIAAQGISILGEFLNSGQRVLNPQLLQNPCNASLFPSQNSAPLRDMLQIYKMLIEGDGSEMQSEAAVCNNLKNATVLINRFIFEEEAFDEFDEIDGWGRSSSSLNQRLNCRLLELYREHADSEYSGLFLSAINGVKVDSPQMQEYYDSYVKYCNRFPNSNIYPNVENQIKHLTTPSVSASYPSLVSPGVPTFINLKVENAHEVLLEIYDVSGSGYNPNESSWMLVPPGLKPVDTQVINLEEQIPYALEKKVEIVFPKYGIYLVNVICDGEKARMRNNIIHASNLTLGVGQDEQMAVVVNPLTGDPVADALIEFYPWSRRNLKTWMPGQTSADGLLSVEVSESGKIVPVKGEDQYAAYENIYPNQPKGLLNRLSVNIFTSLGLYRPGDKVEFALVAYRTSHNKREIASDQQLFVELYNANYTPIDTIKVQTDSWGRAKGEFTLPSSGLTGVFSLAVKSPGNNHVGSRNFTVSDYKLPKFEVKVVDVLPPATLSSPAKIEGCARAYSGFPISEAIVKGELKVMVGRWWSRSESPVFYTFETHTDSLGNFTVEIPAEIIAGSPAPNGLFVCDMTVTSDNGESHPLTAQFNMGKPLVICPDIPSKINVGNPIKAQVEIFNALNEKVGYVPLTYEIKRENDIVKSGKLDSQNLAAILKELSVGVYSITFTPVDSTLAETSLPFHFVIYSNESEICPVEAPLWVPVNSLVAGTDRIAKIPVGSSVGDAHVLMSVTIYPGKNIERRWLHPSRGIQTIEVAMPEGTDRVSVNFLCVKDFKSQNYRVDIAAPVTRKGISTVETFRDKVSPGELETIAIRVAPDNGASTLSAIMLDMSNKAIDALQSNPWQFPEFKLPYFSVGFRGFDFSKFSLSYSASSQYLTDFNVVAPTFNLYGQSFANHMFREMAYAMGAPRMMRKSSRAMADYNDDADMDIAPDAMENNMESVAVVNSGTGGIAEEAAEENANSDENQNSYRPSEIPLAFFKPMLETDDEGNLEVKYEVPNAVTTWVLRGIAYNKELLASSFQSEIVASKQIMVATNPPRFLRTGDSLNLPASVMNNTDSVLQIAVVMEAISSDNQRVVASDKKTVTVKAGASEVVSLPVEASASLAGIIFRVKASVEGFSDGEQVFIPVLPSRQDVVESEIFYIPSDQPQFTIELPAMDGGDRAYLNFTENPSWQVVSALPGLRQGGIESSVSAGAALFSAAVAEGLMRDYPEVARTLRKWNEQGDSALISNLEKNQEIKSMLLDATPWVSNALSETERMQRLVLLFDSQEVARVKREAIDQLARCQTSKGWCWTEQYKETSPWATMVILGQLGELNRLGYLPKDQRLNSMIKTAIKAIDLREAADFLEYPKLDRWLYVATRDLFPEYKYSTAASKVVEAQVQRCLADWKNSDVAVKAIYAQILDNHGYSATARQVLESLRQLSTSTPERGMWWQQLDRYTTFWSYDRIGITALILDAFVQIEPKAAEIEKIRQWLILNKTNNDWGNAVMTTQTVAAILRSGKPLTVNTRGTAIHIGAELLEPSSQEYATGAFTENITSYLASSETLTIDRQADYPSVGAIVMMRTLPMDSIKGVDCKEISIEKSMLVFDGTQWVEKQAYNVGDKVRIELIIKVEDDLSYVVIEDQRAAGLEPVEQLPKPIFAEGLCFYRENRDDRTNIFIDYLPRGVYRLSYELFASQEGIFSSGVAQVQSQYNPIVSAHSAGDTLEIK